MIYFLFFR